MQMKSCTECIYSAHCCPSYKENRGLCLALMCIRRSVKPMRWFKTAVFGLFSRAGLKTAEGSRNLDCENKMMT